MLLLLNQLTGLLNTSIYTLHIKQKKLITTNILQCFYSKIFV